MSPYEAAAGGLPLSSIVAQASACVATIRSALVLPFQRQSGFKRPNIINSQAGKGGLPPLYHDCSYSAATREQATLPESWTISRENRSERNEAQIQRVH